MSYVDMIQIFRSITRLRYSTTRRVCSRRQQKLIRLHRDGIGHRLQPTALFILRRLLLFLRYMYCCYAVTFGICWSWTLCESFFICTLHV